MEELQHQSGVRSGVGNTTVGVKGADGCERTLGLLQISNYYYVFLQ